MRVVGSKQHQNCSITFFHWNNRYLIKVESGLLEQTYKIQDYELTSEDDLNRIASDEFINQCMLIFNHMAGSMQKSIEGLQ